VSVPLLPLIVLAIVVIVDLWVYVDARAQEQRGSPIVCSLGAFVVDTPGTWLVCCLVLFLVFVPLYLVGRAA
jgi:hypothetical protein